MEFPLEKSPNPKASEHFVNAMQYKFMIISIHRLVDYDNFLMTPFLNKMKEEYEKGKELLPKDSAEDVYWYVILFRGIHGIGGIPDDYDMSLAYENILSKEEYKQHYIEIVNKIKRLATNDFNFDVPRITQYKYEFMVNLVDEVMAILIDEYKSSKEIFLNKDYKEGFKSTYKYYKNFSNKYLPQANKQNKNKVVDIYMKLHLSSYVLSFKIHQTRKANCDNIEYRNMINNLKILKQMSLNPKYKNQTFYYENIFNNLMIYEKMKVLKVYCPKLKNEAIEISKYFNPQLEKKTLKKEK
ncbi:hypothetical protein [Halarcobacter anaerophilus]|uniref:hypothetical protein n=1 Tax=Halarcobacter anaerophilus TaxID=877500 RepID=UPI0005C9EAF0|nr:hypothetical protein [Halarcobacter anaerophilus]